MHSRFIHVFRIQVRSISLDNARARMPDECRISNELSARPVPSFQHARARLPRVRRRARHHDLTGAAIACEGAPRARGFGCPRIGMSFDRSIDNVAAGCPTNRRRAQSADDLDPDGGHSRPTADSLGEYLS